MHSPQIDLLSYAYIRTEVERLFKAYLDARLIELAKAHNKLMREKETNPLHYWEGVLSILDKTFGWQSPNPKAGRKAGDKAADKDADSEDSIAVLLRQLDAKASGVNDPDTSPYLYWFDVRASYWSPVGDSKWTSLVDALPSRRPPRLGIRASPSSQESHPGGAAGSVADGQRGPRDNSGGKATRLERYSPGHRRAQEDPRQGRGSLGPRPNARGGRSETSEAVTLSSSVKLTHDGLSLWYGTPDAPAPGDEGVVPRSGTSLVVGVHPANPTNTVLVRYRIDRGVVQTAPGRELRTDYDRRAQYFLVAFPPFPVGDLVEYAAVLGCGGRQVPSAAVASRLSSTFRLAPKEPAAKAVCRASSSGRPAAVGRRFDPGLGFVVTVTLSFDPPQFIGETAAGMRINFFVREGTVKGEGVSGKVLGEHRTT